MVSIFKNQLLKHLSRFTKNLSADKINISTFKGEGELKNLELNEEVLTDLLELPSWLKLTKAWSNKVSFRVQWTKLKSVPICLNLDEVNIIVETCEELRPMSPQSGLPSYAVVPGKYSFIHKVIDGITIFINTVNITFNSPAFTASVQVSRINVESKDPYWRKCDLRMSRLKEPDKGQILIFKELTWQTVRIEAKSTKDPNLTPIRLLTNQAWCRITFKKRISDSYIIGSRMVVILDDLLWVLTDSQLKAALCFVDSLAGLIQKATLLSRATKAARKLEELPEYQAQVAQQSQLNSGRLHSSKLFTKCDVAETSYHFFTQHITLHLCDDAGAGRSCNPRLKDGGALQITVNKFKVDYYPYHLAKSDRKRWPGYREYSSPHTQWFEESFAHFKGKLLDLINKNKHTPLSRATKVVEPGFEVLTESVDLKRDQLKDFFLLELGKLMTSCLVLRIDDFTLYKVVTAPLKKQELKVFVSGDKDRMSLPENSNVIHAEFIYFYYPNDTPFPLPPPKFYVHVNPLLVSFDVDTCLWLNSFLITLYQTLSSSKSQVSKSDVRPDVTYIDVKIEAILPKIVFENANDYPNQRDRPKALHINVTRATITNVRSLHQSSRADLAKCVETFRMGSLFFNSGFPSKPDDLYLVTQKFLDHITTSDNVRSLPEKLEFSSKFALMDRLSRELFWNDAKDVWSIHLEPVWADFVGAKSVGNKPVTFVDTIPITIWLHATMDPNSTLKTTEDKNGSKYADIHALTHISSLVSVQINHYQYLFLLRLLDDVAEMTTFLSLDSKRILKTDSLGSLVVGAVIPQLEMTIVMPSQNPGKESSGGDAESFFPESSSIQDDVQFQGYTDKFDENIINSEVDASGEAVKRKWDFMNNIPVAFKLPSSQLNEQPSHFKTKSSHESRNTEEADVKSKTNSLKLSQRRSKVDWAKVSKPTSQGGLPEYIKHFEDASPEIKLSLYPSNKNKENLSNSDVDQLNTTEKIGRNKAITDNTNNPVSNSPEFISRDVIEFDESDINSSVKSKLNSGFSSMKKSFINMIDSKVKPSLDEISETMSIKSDISSDSEQMRFIITDKKELEPDENLFVVDQFEENKEIEVASEVEEDSVTTLTSEHSYSSSYKRRDLVSTATFKFNKVELLQQSRGFSSSVKVQVGDIYSDECSSISWDEFQVKFSSRTRVWSDTNTSQSDTPKVKLRLDHKLKINLNATEMDTIDFSDKDIQHKLFDNLLEVYVNDLTLNLCMSVVTGLTDFIEDEIFPTPLPLMVHLKNIELHLNEDRPLTNITSPGPVPIDLTLSKMFIKRSMDGVFHIEPEETVNEGTSFNEEERNLQLVIKKLREENHELRRCMDTLQQVSKENSDLRVYKEKFESAIVKIAVLEEQDSRLLAENRKLLEALAKSQLPSSLTSQWNNTR